MVSFISTLSLFILVLANGYFTFPAHDEKNWSSTFSPLSHGLGGATTERPRPLREVSNDLEKNELLPEHPTHPSPFNSMGSEMPSATERLPGENVFQKLRVLNNKDHLESSTFTTEPSHMDERDLYESSTFTTEPSHMDERDLYESSTFTTEPSHMDERDLLESSTFTTEPSHMDERDLYESSTFTTESSHIDERDLHESSTFTTESSHMHEPEAGRDGEKGKDKRDELHHDDHHHDHLDNNESFQYKREEKPMQIESTTLFAPSFPSTSAAAAPQFESSTKKYLGSLRDDQDNEGDKPIPKVPETSDDSLATTYPTPQLDQEGLKDFTNVPNDILNLDRSNSYVVTDIASTARATTMENKDQDQDQEQRKPKPSTKGAKNQE